MQCSIADVLTSERNKHYDMLFAFATNSESHIKRYDISDAPYTSSLSFEDVTTNKPKRSNKSSFFLALCKYFPRSKMHNYPGLLFLESRPGCSFQASVNSPRNVIAAFRVHVDIYV